MKNQDQKARNLSRLLKTRRLLQYVACSTGTVLFGAVFLGSGCQTAEETPPCTYQPGDLPSTTLAGQDLEGLRSKIEHIVVIIQENRSFDHLFAHNSRARSICDAKDHRCIEGYGSWKDRHAGPPVHAEVTNLPDPPHSWFAMHAAFHDGRMDNFYMSGGQGLSSAISYYLEQDHPYYSWLLDEYATSDSFYASMLGPTWPNRDYLIWGSSFGMPDNYNAPPKSAVSPGPTDQGIFSQLEAARVSWKLYWSSSLGQAIKFPYEKAIGWKYLLFGKYCATPDVDSAYCTTPVATIDDDLANGTLPSVIFYESGEDEHPYSSEVHSGENAVRTVVTKLMQSSYWDKTLIVLTYDEGGGFFDHRVPPKACGDFTTPFDLSQRGMRIPLMVISPYAKPGYVSHTIGDHASVLRLLQARWDLPAMMPRDANAHALLDMLDFSMPPRAAPTIIPNAAAVAYGDGQLIGSSLWNDALPIAAPSSTTSARELGVKFASLLPSPQVIGIKYWVGDKPELGVKHVGNLWDPETKQLLGSVTFPEETAVSGNRWQTAYFDMPIPIDSRRIYIASRNTQNGDVPTSAGYFDLVKNPAHPEPRPDGFGNLFTCANLSTCNELDFGVNGIVADTEGAMPYLAADGTNHWVDVLVK